MALYEGYQRSNQAPGAIVTAPVITSNLLALPSFGQFQRSTLEVRTPITPPSEVRIPEAVPPGGWSSLGDFQTQQAALAVVQPGVAAAPQQMAMIGGAISLGIWLVRHLGLITALSLRLGVTVTRTISWIRRNVFMIAKTAGWIAAGVWLSDILNLDQDEGMRVALEISGEGEPKKRRRLTIGHNPRARTLLRVARFTSKLLKRQQKMFKEFFPQTSRRGELAARERAHHRMITKAVD